MICLPDRGGYVRKMVAQNGMMDMGALHPGKVLAMTRIYTGSERLFIGNSQVGHALFAADPGAGAYRRPEVNAAMSGQRMFPVAVQHSSISAVKAASMRVRSAIFAWTSASFPSAATRA